MVVKLDDMMKKLFTPKERAAIRRDARAIARRHMALRELREARSRTQVAMARKLGVIQNLSAQRGRYPHVRKAAELPAQAPAAAPLPATVDDVVAAE